jgi:chromosome segregation ATPase
VSETILNTLLLVVKMNGRRTKKPGFFAWCRMRWFKRWPREVPDKKINNDLAHEVKSLKTELGAAKTREASTDLEKAEIESKLQDAMERTEFQETELGAAKTREESTDLEKAEIDSKLQDAMERIESQETELRGAKTR